MDLILTKNNFYKFGYGTGEYNCRKNTDSAFVEPENKWFVRYDSCTRLPGTFREECIATAKEIYEQAKGQPIWIGFSGGIDSEIVVQSFMFAKIPFRVAIIKHSAGTNQHDIAYAISFCNRHNIDFTIFDLDLETFTYTLALEYAALTECYSVILTSYMWLIDQLDGYVVYGGDDYFLGKPVPNEYIPGESPYIDYGEWRMRKSEIMAAPFRFLIARNREGCPGFFHFTPEIMLSYLRDKYIVDLVSNRIVGKLSTRSIKLSAYQQHFLLEPRPKYTGLENIKHLTDAIIKMTPPSVSNYQQLWIPYTELISMLWVGDKTDLGIDYDWKPITGDYTWPGRHSPAISRFQ